MLGRLMTIAIALVLTAVGAVSLGMSLWPDHEIVKVAGRVVTRVAASALSGFATGDDPVAAMQATVQGVLAAVWMRFGALPAGVVLLITALLPGRNRIDPAAFDDDPASIAPQTLAAVDRKAEKKARRAAAALAKKGHKLEAAEYCFDEGLFDDAADYFVAAEEFVRAAEIRHDQNRFTDSAKLYLKAKKPEFAARIFAQQEDWARAGKAYQIANNQSEAAEMFEKAGDHLSCAQSYEAAGFPRHAAQAYVKCSDWKKAAVCLEQAIQEESTGHGDRGQNAQVEKLVRMAGYLFERAGLNERAAAVLMRGGCFTDAAELALKGERHEEAAELFIKAKNPTRAAEVLAQLDRGEESALLLAEHYRDQGDEEQAAAQFAKAGDWLTAGDLYRVLERYDRAAECYEHHGDAGQAAEMHAVGGDHERASACYERAGLYAEAAECTAELGDDARQSELLVKAGKHLQAGEIHMKAGRQDAAVKALQQIASDHPDFTTASAIVGDVFCQRGQHTLAIAKLRTATEGAAINAYNARAFYGLAQALEGNGDITEACDLYETILSFDYDYLDVEDCLERTRTKLEKRAQQAESATASTPTSRQGRYKIVGKLGRGGMGVVYKAVDTVLDRTVAFKVLPDTLRENPQALKNFLREAKSAAMLNHPGIVTVFDAGEQDGVFYIAMEHVDGNTLKDIVKHRGKISPGGIVHVMAQMCEALAYAHEKKVVHRDIKTANTMWTRDRKAKIMDFGLARVIEEVRNHTTVVSGTPYYMSPEQTLGKNVDHRTDIYSLGVTIFELATGTLPFREGNLPYHHVHTAPPDPREFNAELPPLLAEIILRCLAKDPADRFQSAKEIVATLREALRSRAGGDTTG